MNATSRVFYDESSLQGIHVLSSVGIVNKILHFSQASLSNMDGQIIVVRQFRWVIFHSRPRIRNPLSNAEVVKNTASIDKHASVIYISIINTAVAGKKSPPFF